MLNGLRTIGLTVLIMGSVASQDHDGVILQSTLLPHSVTYNGSDDPNECWESVDWGVLLPHKKRKGFFLMGDRDLERLRQKVSSEEILEFEVTCFAESLTGSGAIGAVLRVRRGNEVLFEEK